ncbi:DUF4381 domain-containing protein [uncultured Shewanella sp.]|uniref:DUF4381 domain-containing protein n=1 Tax=uncultured Shewanella sp. TaxID=173975 RepID=UPI00260A605F|nr:DUF4381 domain-containing protein [uncultured Shewanella sp.]
MSVTPNPALASLKDIHLPTAIGHWPLPIGYWIVIVISIIVLCLIGIFTLKRLKYTAAKREALSQLAALQPGEEYFAIQVNSILKRAAMSYVPRHQIASLEGTAWYHWLTQQSDIPQLSQLLDNRYQAAPLSVTEQLTLKTVAKKWLVNSLPIKIDTAQKEKMHSASKEPIC